MNDETLSIYKEIKPDHFIGGPSITINAKAAEIQGIEYELLQFLVARGVVHKREEQL